MLFRSCREWLGKCRAISGQEKDLGLITERDQISNCGAFFRLEPAPCSCTLGGGEPGLGAVAGQGFSPQLEKVVPSLEGCTIAQNLPAFTTHHSG